MYSQLACATGMHSINRGAPINTLTGTVFPFYCGRDPCDQCAAAQVRSTGPTVPASAVARRLPRGLNALTGFSKLKSVRLANDVALDLTGTAVHGGHDGQSQQAFHAVLGRVAVAAHHLHSVQGHR